MGYIPRHFIFFITLITFIYHVNCADTKIAGARIESCPGCSLNRLPEVKSFIFEDIPKYNIEFKRIQGAKPELILLDASDEEIERIPLASLNRKQCNELLQSKGFKMSGHAEF